MWKDLSFSLRTLRRSPLFTAAAVISLALGIGANTAIFSLLNQVVMRSLPVRDPERLVLFHTEYNGPGTSSSDNSESVFSNPMYRDLNQRVATFDGVIARMSGTVRLAGVGLGNQGGTDSASVEMVSGNFFQVLGVGAALGRVIAPTDDDAAGAHPVVALSHRYWSSHFAGSPAILNQSITLNGHPFVVIGVGEPRFNGIIPGRTEDLYVPITMQRAILPTMDALEDRRTRWLNLFARLKPGISIRQAQAATDVAYRSILETEMAQSGSFRTDRDRDEFRNHRAELRPASQGISELRQRWEKPLAALMTLVGLVLVIACANVASLMLARAAGRQREIAIRLAIGAGRIAMVRQLLLEALMLALAGGVIGLAVSNWSIEALVRILPKGYANTLSAAIDATVTAVHPGSRGGVRAALRIDSRAPIDAARPGWHTEGAGVQRGFRSGPLSPRPGDRATGAFAAADCGSGTVRRQPAKPPHRQPGVSNASGCCCSTSTPRSAGRNSPMPSRSTGTFRNGSRRFPA